MNDPYTAAVQLREEITAVKAHLATLYDRRAVMCKQLAATMTTRELATLFGVKNPLIVRTINDQR